MEWHTIDGDFVYTLNGQGTNRFSCGIQPGFDDEGKRISKEEVASITRLIAAAPDLLAALRLCLPIVAAHCEASHLTEGFARRENREDRILKRIKGVIEKAEG